MKNVKKILGVIAIATMIGIGLTACDDGGGTSGGNTGGNTNTNQTPVADDYNIDNLNQKLITGNVIGAVTIAAKSGKSPGAISNIRYAGNTAVPQTLGTYAVYFSVAAATGWNAAPDIFAGNLIITDYNIGDTGPGGGKIIYVSASGFNVAGLGTCHYLEAAPTNQATSVTWSSTYVYVTAGATAIGTGKANTAAIIAAHSSDTVSNNAAKVAVAYTGGGKNDWFLPSKDELNEMYKARTYLGISPGWFWSSSQFNAHDVWSQYFDYGSQANYAKNYNFGVRAVRAF